MFRLILVVIFGCLALGMWTDPLATAPFAIGAAVLVSLYLLVNFLRPAGKDRTKPESYAIMDLLALLSPWH